jgi:hypothetical protein
MSATITERDAKEFLVSQIAGEAERQGHPLSDLERKMLYFSESGWTIPDALDVSTAFDREYDTDQYEQKIAGLAQAARTRATGETAARWTSAIDKLAEGDHYISITLGEAHPREETRFLIWFGVIAIGLGFVTLISFDLSLKWYLGHAPTREEIGFYAWATAAAVGGACGLASYAFGGDRIGRFVHKVIGQVTGHRRK